MVDRVHFEIATEGFWIMMRPQKLSFFNMKAVTLNRSVYFHKNAKEISSRSNTTKTLILCAMCPRMLINSIDRFKELINGRRRSISDIIFENFAHFISALRLSLDRDNMSKTGNRLRSISCRILDSDVQNFYLNRLPSH